MEVGYNIMSQNKNSMGDGCIFGERWRRVGKDRRYQGHGDKSENFYHSSGEQSQHLDWGIK